MPLFKKGELEVRSFLIQPDPTPIHRPRCPVTIEQSNSTSVPLLNLHALREQARSICVTALPAFLWVGCKAAQPAASFSHKGQFRLRLERLLPNSIGGALDKVIYNNTAVTFCFPRWKWMNSSSDTVDGGKWKKKNRSVKVYEVTWEF